MDADEKLAREWLEQMRLSPKYNLGPLVVLLARVRADAYERAAQAVEPGAIEDCCEPCSGCALCSGEAAAAVRALGKPKE